MVALAQTTDNGPVTEPAWMSKLDTMPVLLAFALGAFLPNYIVVVAAAGQVLQLNQSNAVLIGLGVIFLRKQAR